MTSEKQHPDAAPRSAAEAADRLRRPSWKDPRLIVGVLLVVVSMAGVVALVGSQDRTAPVYAADRTISVGEPVSAEDLRVVDVRLDDVSGQYLSADREPPADLQFVSVVEEGELVPARAVDAVDPLGRQAVTLEIEDTLARAVEPGRAVDLWTTTPGAIGEDAGARVDQVVAGAEVSAVTESSSTFGAQSAVTVELLVAPDDLPEVLAARSSAAALSLVPAGAAPAAADHEGESAPDGESTEGEDADEDEGGEEEAP
ncbi:hypothetical protein Q7C18_00650 [Nesterenkonia sp. CL21]|uniref:hypothetical protein n=1 Tax=Nesterenkonia sp. CL21 TaxID=3064894 RepID=UPI0028798A0C|nr:hypothetical protein [Nesterenkonia sp. CL21]MDS2171206.1 hypothetical protein [Nesterenkonia sp. CL21]